MWANWVESMGFWGEMIEFHHQFGMFSGYCEVAHSILIQPSSNMQSSIYLGLQSHLKAWLGKDLVPSSFTWLSVPCG